MFFVTMIRSNMMKKFISAIIFSIFMMYVPANALELVLTTPIVRQAITTIRVDDVIDRPRIKRINFTVLFGYTSGNEFTEIERRELEINEPQYTTFHNRIRTSGKSIE